MGEANMILILVILACIYVCLPWYVTMVISLVNTFIPDPVPLVDELFMYLVTIIRIKRAMEDFSYYSKKKKILIVLVILLIVAGLILLIKNILG